MRLWLAAAAVLTLALPVRIWHLDVPTITHPEIYSPGIDFHDFARTPMERKSVSTIVRSSLIDDNHPPGYYLAMLPWTAAFGTSAGALRAPSVAIGVLTVLGVLLLAWRREGPAVATLAAGWLALHGQHVMWSRQARMWVLCAAMAVLSALALERLREAWTSRWAWMYVVATSIGLWADYTYWPFLAAQIVWVVVASRTRSTAPAILSLQAWAIVAASPVFVFLLSRLGSSAYLDAPTGNVVRYFLAFDAWFDPRAAAVPGSYGGPILLLLSVAGAVLLVVGALARSAIPPSAHDGEDRPPLAEWPMAAAVAWPLLLAWLWRNQPTDPNYPVWTVTLSIPVVVAAGHYVVRRTWPRLSPALRRLANVPVIARVIDDGMVLQAVLPFLVLVAASPVLPALAPRTTLLLAPFVVIVASRGLFRLLPTISSRVAGGAVVLALGSASTHDALAYPPVTDYKGLATALLARAQPDMVYSVEDAWALQPMQYYLKPGEVTVIPLTGLTRNDPTLRRVWVLSVGEGALTTARKLAAPLAGFTETDRVEALRSAAVLFERR